MDKLVISDTNIFIVLLTMNLLSEVFMLPCEIHTIDMVLLEIEKIDQKEKIMSFVEIAMG